MLGVPTIFDFAYPQMPDGQPAAAEDEQRGRATAQADAHAVMATPCAASVETNSTDAAPTTISPGMFLLSVNDSPAWGRVVLAQSTGSVRCTSTRTWATAQR
jgi:hypothetical protein